MTNIGVVVYLFIAVRKRKNSYILLELYLIIFNRDAILL